MKNRCWSRAGLLGCAAAGMVLMLSRAEAQTIRYPDRAGYGTAYLYQGTPSERSSNEYGSGFVSGGNRDAGLIKPLQVQATAPRLEPGRIPPAPSTDAGAAAIGQAESGMTPVDANRMAELEAAVAELRGRLDAAGQILPGYSEFPGACQPADCNGCPDPCCPPVVTGFYGGFEFLWLQPNFDNSIAFLSSGPGENLGNGMFGGVAQRSDARAHEFDYDFELSPRIFLGWTHQSGWGIRTRYFQFDASANRPFTTIVPNGDAETPAFQPYLGSGDHFFMDHGIGTEFRAAHSLKIQTWDLEVTNQLVFCRSLVTAGLGLRWVGIDQRYRADTIWAGTDILETLYYNHNFYGAGPTLSLEMVRPFSCCTGLAFYATGRGSVLFGERSQYFKKEDGNTGALTETFTRRDADTAIYIAEVGMGLQYTRGIFFGRTGWEGQWWANAGGPTTTNGDLGLHGISLTLGINY